MIVATAGHIDHGKTKLVKALTGVNTDRLPEERERGISIDLGFAHVDLGDSHQVSFIDVPGHERFIRNMLAGVIGIDAALLVVAADDGVMPQTLEHLHILDLLEIRHGAIAITKVDSVDPAQLRKVTNEVRTSIAGTFLQEALAFPISSFTGAGLPALIAWLKERADASTVDLDPMHRFRMPVDRAFTVTGIGTIVTGTVQSGSIQVGAQLSISPIGQEVRIRGIQVQGKPTDCARPGQRCALNLAGISLDQVGRGDWMEEAGNNAPTHRLDARLKVLSSGAKPFDHWTSVHLHIGTTDVLARAAVPGEASIAPGESSFIQLVTERPITALHGDRFVIRDHGAKHTIGGGIVLDPFAPKRKRGGGLRTAELQVYERRAPSRVLAGLLDLSESGVDLRIFNRAMNLTAIGAQDVLQEAQVVTLGKSSSIGITRAAAEALMVRVLDALHSFHSQHPQAVGLELANLRSAVAPKLIAEAFQSFVRSMANRQLLVLSNDIVRLESHEASANAEDEKLWARVRKVLLESGVKVPLLAELSATLQVKEQLLRDFLHRKSRTGEIRRVMPERFVLRETLTELAEATVSIAQSKDDGFFSASEFRDLIGTGRSLAIHYLEYFDQIGITQRFGDLRRVGKSYVSIL